MKHILTYFCLICVPILIISGNLNAKEDFPVLKGSYLGQKPPGVESKNYVDPIEMQTLEKAKIIARRIMIIDCHSHNLFQPGSADKPKQVSFSLLKESGVKGIVQSFPLDFRAINNPSEDILKNIIDTKNKIKKESLNISAALKSSDFFSPNSDDSFTMMLGIEYFKGIFGGNIKMLEKYHKEGVRVIGIVRTGGLDNIYVNDNLTEFGSELIGEINRLGIICDITHLTESAQIKIIEASQAPVILSHTNAYSVVNSGFNVTDTTLEKLTAKGGIICVTFFSGQLSRRALNYLNEKKDLNQLPRASIEELVDQIDYLKKKVGIDYIGIGSDYGGSGRMSPEGLETIEGFPMIIYHMLKRNYSKNEIEKVMGLNFINFYERVENKAELLKGNVNTQQDDWPVLKGPYLGQKPPGMMPEIFAPGIISTQHKEHSTLAFSPDGTEIYWSIWPVPRSKKIPQTIMFMKIENGKWSEPQAAPFSGKYMDGGPAFFPDGKKLFFYSNRPIKKNGKPKEDSDFWYVNRTKKGWSEPVHAGFLVNSKNFEQALSFSANWNMYFSVGFIVNGKWESSIYRSILKDGIYSKPVNISHLVNTTQCSGLRPYISPDESFIIFSSDCRRFSPKGKYLGGKRRLVITFKKDDDTWYEKIEMGSEINISYEGARFPGMSPDGKYLFFTRYDEKWNEDIYWVDAKIIEALKPINLK